MFDKKPILPVTPADVQKKSFSRMASFKMKKTVKSLSRALSIRKKSWKLNSNYSSALYQEDESINGSYQDQSVLEQSHKDEKDELRKRLSEERQQELQLLDQTLEEEMEQTTEELLANFNHMSLDENCRDLAIGMLNRAGEEAKRYREKRVRKTQKELATKETSCFEKLNERHEEEMLNLTANMSTEINETAESDFPLDTDSPLPSTTRKLDLYESQEEFEELDQHAIQLSSLDYTNFTDLVRDLTQDCQNELEIARMLFRWVVAISQSSSSSALLKSVKHGSDSYHQLYRKLCSYAGLPCKIILGYSKGAGYRPGMEIEVDAFRNSWTAVAIDGSWRFVNCTWAARHVTGTTDEMCHRLDDFYFLTDPEDHIYQHYPDDPAWQLLENPLGLRDFVNLPAVKSSFFKNNLHFSSSQKSVLTTESGVTEIRLVAPEILAFGSVLQPCGEHDLKQQPIDNAVLQRIVDGEVVFTIHLPKPGQYYFSMFVGDYWNPECLENTCSFSINCTNTCVVPGPVSAPFPSVPYYGPTPVMGLIGLSPESHADPLVVSVDGNLDIKLNVVKDTKLTQTLEYVDSLDGSLTDTDRFVFVRSRDDSSISYTISCPEKGYYVFSVFGADGSGDSTSLDCIYRYLIVCQSDNQSAKAFPRTFPRWQHCTLHAPLTGDLLPCKRHTFELVVPGAEDVLLSFGYVSLSLERTAGCDTWGGDIETGETTSMLRVIARFPSGQGSSIFTRLLEFDLIGVRETEL